MVHQNARMPNNEPTSVSDLLRTINLGSPVAEHDTALANYFLETDTFSSLINDQRDTIAGDKGTGKTALFKILKDRFTRYKSMNDVEVLAAFNATGEPVFQRLLEAGTLDENRYIGLWKAYFVMVAGNWLLELYGDARPGSLEQLENMLENAGLRSGAAKPASLFTQLVGVLRATKIEASGTVTGDGLPLFAATVSFKDKSPNSETPTHFVRFAEALGLVETCLEEAGVKLWLVLDRLDEAFQAHPEVELPALRALFRSYLDLQDLDRLKLKLFVRRDLFARIIKGGFVNLTHINARNISITWEDADLFALLFNRLKESKRFVELANLEGADSKTVFATVFPEKVDPGTNRPLTWNWILTRIRDGNGVKSPRNLVDLVIKAIEAQQRREATSPRTHADGQPLITGDALKRALTELSIERIEDTLLAEAGDSADLIRRFEGGKAEHNADSLGALFGADADSVTKQLISLGFLESVGQTYKVPMLYRSGMQITKGKAFGPDASKAVDDMESDE